MSAFDSRLDGLLAAAAKTFADQGFHGTSMRDLSRATGLSLSGMYHYVQSKHELLFRIQERCFGQVIAGARDAVAEATDPESRLKAFIRHHVVFFAGHVDEMKVLSHEDEELSGTMAAEIRRRKREYVDLLTGLLESVEDRTVDPQLAAYALFGMMNWIYTWYHPNGPILPSQLAEAMGRLFVDGYRNPLAHAATPIAASQGG